MAEEKKMIYPPPPPPEGCFGPYPSDRDLAIQMLHMAITLLNRKHNKWDMPPVIMPMARESKEEA